MPSLLANGRKAGESFVPQVLDRPLWNPISCYEEIVNDGPTA